MPKTRKMPNPWKLETPAGEIFLPGSQVVFLAAQSKIPVKFHPRVLFCGPDNLVLNFPDEWWKLLTLEAGMPVSVSQWAADGVYRLEGRVQWADRTSPQIILTHDGKAVREQRRLFFRMPVEIPVFFDRVFLADGAETGGHQATLQDISGGGIAFWQEMFLPPDSRLETHQLLAGKWPDFKEQLFRFNVVWCRPRRSQGFCLGARFDFINARQQDEVIRAVNRLQWTAMWEHRHAWPENK